MKKQLLLRLEKIILYVNKSDISIIISLTKQAAPKTWELFLVFGLDVVLKVTKLAETFTTMNTIMVFGLDVVLQVTKLAECCTTIRTLMRPLTQFLFSFLFGLDMLLQVTLLKESPRTVQTTVQFLLGMDSLNMNLEVTL